MPILLTILFAPVMGVLTVFYVGKMILCDLASFAGWILGHIVGMMLFGIKCINPAFTDKFFDKVEKWSDD